MTQEEIIEMARQAGFEKVIEINPNTGIKTIQAYDSNSLTSFAKLVAAKERADEREACAVMCDSVYHQNIGPEFGEVRYGIASCAKAIRARGEA